MRRTSEVCCSTISAGVPVTLVRYDGTVHGFTRRLNRLDVARAALRDIAAALRSALAPRG